MDKHLRERFGGIDRLYGSGALARFAACHLTVVGIGGVGSWAVEALARSGIGKLTLVDADDLCVSNTNRQLPALEGQYGRGKAEAMAERCRAINPASSWTCKRVSSRRRTWASCWTRPATWCWMPATASAARSR